MEFDGGVVDGGDNGFDRDRGGEGPAGRVLLQGERVAGSVRQGQVTRSACCVYLLSSCESSVPTTTPSALYVHLLRSTHIWIRGERGHAATFVLNFAE